MYVLVGDGSYLMMAQEIVTSLQEGYKLNIVLLDNHGFSSIGGLSRSVRQRRDGHELPLSSRREVRRRNYFRWILRQTPRVWAQTPCAVRTHRRVRGCAGDGKEARRTNVVVVETSYDERVPGYESWWDVPIAEVSETEMVRAARRKYEEARKKERYFLLDDQCCTRFGRSMNRSSRNNRERGQGGDNHRGSAGGDTRATSSETRAGSLGPDLLRSDPDFADCGGAAVRRSASSLARAFRCDDAAGHGGDVGNGGQFRTHGVCLSLCRIGVHLCQSRIESRTWDLWSAGRCFWNICFSQFKTRCTRCWRSSEWRRGFRSRCWRC